MTNESVDDIERELREYGDRPPPRCAWIDLADRLHAAYKRDMQAIVDANETAMKTAMDEVTRLREGNERLKAALNPVLEVEWPTGISGSIDNQLLEPLTYICNAVRSAQLIYNGGAK